MRIQHNIMAMNAYRNYSNNTSALSSNLEKLSSGYKINRAGDDAAGLAISEKMRAQITGLDVAQKNAKDGISLVQTAEGALTEVHDMLNRMVELASQSANGTYDNETDRDNLQKEMDQLLEEIDRIADSANFNGINLLDGTMSENVAATGMTDVNPTVVADGAMADEAQAGIYSIDLSQWKMTAGSTAATLTFEVAGATVTLASNVTVGANTTMTGDQLAAALDGATVEIDDVTYNITANGGTITLTGEKAPAADATTGIGEFTITNGTGNQGDQFAVTVEQEAVKEGSRLYGKAEYTLQNVADGTALKIGDTTYVFAVGKDSQFAGMANVVDLTDIEADNGDLATIAANRLTTVAKDNKNFLVGTDGAGKLTFTEKEGGVDYAVNNLAGGTAATDGDWTDLIQIGTVDANTSTSGLVLQIGDTSDSWNQLRVSIQDMHVDSLGIKGLDISEQGSAQAAIDKIKAAINTVSSVRGTLGATQNRLDHTINNLSVMEENIQDAESTIRDTDVAEEMMEYTKNNILIQSAQAMLAQANQVPQGVLQLLQ